MQETCATGRAGLLDCGAAVLPTGQQQVGPTCHWGIRRAHPLRVRTVSHEDTALRAT